MTLSNDSVAVITGAASGIGRALAVRLAREKIGGIAVCDVNESELIETAKIVESLGVSVSTHIADVSKLEHVQKFAGEVAEVVELTELVEFPEPLKIARHCRYFAFGLLICAPFASV